MVRIFRLNLLDIMKRIIGNVPSAKFLFVTITSNKRFLVQPAIFLA